MSNISSSSIVQKPEHCNAHCLGKRNRMRRGTDKTNSRLFSIVTKTYVTVIRRFDVIPVIVVRALFLSCSQFNKQPCLLTTQHILANGVQRSVSNTCLNHESDLLDEAEEKSQE